MCGRRLVFGMRPVRLYNVWCVRAASFPLAGCRHGPARAGRAAGGGAAAARRYRMRGGVCLIPLYLEITRVQLSIHGALVARRILLVATPRAGTGARAGR